VEVDRDSEGSKRSGVPVGGLDLGEKRGVSRLLLADSFGSEVTAALATSSPGFNAV